MKFRLLLISALTLIATPMWASDQQDKSTIIIDPDPSVIVLESGRSISSPHGLITTTIYGDGRVLLSNEAKR